MPFLGGPTLILRHTATRRGASAEVLFTEMQIRVLLGNRASGIRNSRKSSFVLCSDLRTARTMGYTGHACSPGFREEFFSETGSAEGSNLPPNLSPLCGVLERCSAPLRSHPRAFYKHKRVVGDVWRDLKTPTPSRL